MKFKIGIWLMRLGGRLANVQCIDIQYNSVSGTLPDGTFYSGHCSTAFFP